MILTSVPLGLIERTDPDVGAAITTFMTPATPPSNCRPECPVQALLPAPTRHPLAVPASKRARRGQRALTSWLPWAMNAAILWSSPLRQSGTRPYPESAHAQLRWDTKIQITADGGGSCRQYPVNLPGNCGPVCQKKEQTSLRPGLLHRSGRLKIVDVLGGNLPFAIKIIPVEGAADDMVFGCTTRLRLGHFLPLGSTPTRGRH